MGKYRIARGLGAGVCRLGKGGGVCGHSVRLTRSLSRQTRLLLPDDSSGGGRLGALLASFRALARRRRLSPSLAQREAALATVLRYFSAPSRRAPLGPGWI